MTLVSKYLKAFLTELSSNPTEVVEFAVFPMLDLRKFWKFGHFPDPKVRFPDDMPDIRMLWLSELTMRD